MATDFGISLQLDDLEAVEAWLASNANGRTFSQRIQRYNSGTHIFHRHVVSFDDDVFAIEFKFEMGQYILPSIPDQAMYVQPATSFVVKQEYWQEAMGWVIQNVTGVDWSVSQTSYKVEGVHHSAQLFVIKDDTMATLFKLANAQYIVETL